MTITETNSYRGTEAFFGVYANRTFKENNSGGNLFGNIIEKHISESSEKYAVEATHTENYAVSAKAGRFNTGMFKAGEGYGEKQEDINEELKPLGIGFANAGNMGYGMSASLVSSNATDDIIVRVSIAKGNGNKEAVDVNLSEFDPKNATAVEMFAYCQYKDAMGEGSDSKWGSWNAIKSVISPADGMDFGSLDNIINEKRNWTAALAKSKTVMENQKTGKTLSAKDLLKLFMEQNELKAEKLKDGDDWRNMSDDDWDELLAGIDSYIDAYREDIRKRVEKQLEAAQRAAMEADSGLKALASQEAALSVAASGFDIGAGTEAEAEGAVSDENSDSEPEKNWTRKLNTDNQVILRAAKEAQAMEAMALSRMEEITGEGLSTYGLYDVLSSAYLKNRWFG